MGQLLAIGLRVGLLAVFTAVMTIAIKSCKRRPQPLLTLYHYEKKSAIDKIQSRKKISIANQHFGTGVYFTKCCVENGMKKLQIAKNIFGRGM